MKSEDWIGHRQGRLTIESFDGVRLVGRGGGRAAFFTFLCDCGKRFSAQKSNIIGRGRNDCGCVSQLAETAPRGASTDRHHKVWRHMIDRCQNPKNKSFKDYGERGIKVCERWRIGEGGLTGFECFLADMGERPAGNYTIERLEGSDGYHAGNCVWLLKCDQSKNRRGVTLIRIGDRVQTIPDWCAETGILYWTALKRIKRGWPPDKAVTVPRYRAA